MIKSKKKTIILPFSNCAEHPTTALKAMNTETEKKPKSNFCCKKNKEHSYSEGCFKSTFFQKKVLQFSTQAKRIKTLFSAFTIWPLLTNKISTTLFRTLFPTYVSRVISNKNEISSLQQSRPNCESSFLIEMSSIDVLHIDAVFVFVSISSNNNWTRKAVLYNSVTTFRHTQY